MFECNAQIIYADLSTEDHGVLSSFITLDYGGSGQGFGGYSLFSPNFKSNGNFAGLWIWRVMEIVGVAHWKDLVGRTIRVRKTEEWGSIVAIGNTIKDEWFNPKEEFEKLTKGETK
jgi:hypothetical protein